QGGAPRRGGGRAAVRGGPGRRGRGVAVPALLEASGITKSFGGLSALRNVDLAVEEGRIVSLIGPNGAGKTTFFNLVTAIFPPTAGRILFEGQDLVGYRWLGLLDRRRKPHQVTKRGIGRTFQNIRLLQNMPPSDN